MCVKEYHRLWQLSHNSIRDYQKEYRNRDREKLRCSWRERDKRYRMADKKFALNHRMRTLIFQVLRGKKQCVSWKKFVDYTLDDLIRHLESKFTKGMTWERFMKGEIHIDHVLPIDFFQYNSPDDVEFKMCWRLENLQPLWAKDNLRKYNKLSPALGAA